MTGVPSREVIFLRIPLCTASVVAVAISVLGITPSGQAGAVAQATSRAGAFAQPYARATPGVFAQPYARFQVRSSAQLAMAKRSSFNINAFFAPFVLSTSSRVTLSLPSSSVNKPINKPSTASLIDLAGSKAAAQVVARQARSSKAAAPVVARQTRSNAIVVRSTAYNSLAAQTDRTPHITATGARTRFGVVALSRDLLRGIPYGSQVRITDLGQWGSGKNRGQYNGTLSEMLFVVEDTMHQRKRQQIDVWFPSYRAAVRWGVRQVRLEVVRYGRSRY
jgi:3D (Asp-Asp-Asp) domain-containing protein